MRLSTFFTEIPHTPNSLEPLNLEEGETSEEKLPTIKFNIPHRKKEREEIRRQEGEMIKSLGHELRTPLNAILGYSDMLAFDLSDDQGMADITEYSDDIKSIHVAVSRLKRFVQMLFDLLEIYEGKKQLRIINFKSKDLLSIVDEEIKSIHTAYNKKDVEIRVEKDLSVHLHLDWIQVQWMLKEALVNAIERTNSGNISLKERIVYKNDIEYIQFTISDSGGLLSDEQIQVAFDEFICPVTEGENSSTCHSGDGSSGLALALCKKYAVAMGGGMLT